MKVKLK